MNGLLNNPLDRTISAIIGIESGGRWDALGPVIDNPNSRYFGDRAYGVSQVMGRNIPEWTSRYLNRSMTPAEYLADPEAQMGVTRGVIGDWLGQGYSPQEAANLWFTGSANPNPNVSDNLGTSASDYQRRFNERFNQPSAMPAGFQQQFDQFFGQRGGQDMGGAISGMSQPAEPQRGGMFRQPEFWESLALAANTLRLEPDQGLAQQIASQREARAAQQGVNRTVEFFQSRGMDELAQLAQIDPVSAMRQYVQMSQPVQAEPIRGVEVGGNLVNPITGEVIYSGGDRAAEPRSKIAQLRADLAAGLISQEDFEREVQQEPFSRIARLRQELDAGVISQQEFEQEIAMLAGPSMQVSIGPDGSVVFAQGPGAAARPLTEQQSKDVGFALRGEAALNTLDQYDVALTSGTERAAGYDPTGIVRGAVQTEEFQLANQAAEEFLWALLRKDTGAAIQGQERDLYGGTYLPQPGDGPAVIEQKRQARRRAIEGIKLGLPPTAIVNQERSLREGQNGSAPASVPGGAAGNTQTLRYDENGDLIQ